MENYSVKDIVFGLRGEYQKTIKELEELKAFCQTDEKGIEDIKFYLFQKIGKNPELYCDYIEKKSSLRGILKEIKKVTVGCDLSENSAICLRNNNDEFAMMGMVGTFPIYIQDKLNFSKTALKVIDSKFARKIGLKICEDQKKLEMTHGKIEVKSQNAAICYNAFDDTITFDKKGEKLTRIQLLSLLRYSPLFETSSFPSYHRKKIEENSVPNKSIEVEPFYERDFLTFGITEEEKQIKLYTLNSPQQKK